MFKTISIIITFISLVNCDLASLKDYEEDKESFLFAQRTSGALLEPTKELFNRYHKDLAAIRTAYPIVKDVHYSPDSAPGKVMCKGANLKGIEEELGRIDVQDISSINYQLVKFSKPYNPYQLVNILVTIKKLAQSCEVNKIIGQSQSISSSEGNYVFFKGSGDCEAGCINKHYWTFKVEDEKVTLVKESGN